jgi:hypothetical protein
VTIIAQKYLKIKEKNKESENKAFLNSFGARQSASNKRYEKKEHCKFLGIF